MTPQSGEDEWYPLRGGSWSGGRRLCRCASRYDSLPDNFLNYIGFRVVFPGSQPSES
jgi:formylglycine-generating enzyme required for sulfatase activity